MDETARAECNHWDEAARLGARRACWDQDDWDEGQAHCLARVEAGIRPIPTATAVLDLGAGMGRLLSPLSRRFPFVEWVAADVSSRMLRLIVRRPNVHVRLIGDGRTLPQSMPVLAAAYSVLCFQHLPAPAVQGYIKQVAKRLRPGGRFCFQYVEGRNDAWLAHDFQPPVIANWCETAGLTVESHEPDDMFENWRWVTAVKR